MLRIVVWKEMDDCVEKLYTLLLSPIAYNKYIHSLDTASYMQLFPADGPYICRVKFKRL